MGKVLILTEKPSQARDFARALKNCRQREGYYECDEYIITWALGHLFEIDDSIAPKRWSIAALPIFPEKFKLKLRRGAGKQFKVIKKLLKGADKVVLASVSYDEPILVFKGEKPLFTTIGSFVDGLFGYVESANYREQKLLNGEYYCLAFDKRGNVKPRRIRGVIRHKAHKHKLFRVKTSYGREIVASEHHSFFSLKNNKIAPIRTIDLKKGSRILIPKTLNLPEREITIDLLKEFIKQERKDVMVESRCLEKFLQEKAIKKVFNFFGKVAVFAIKHIETLRKKRLKLGYSQADLARLVGIGQSAISQFERGKTNLRVETAEKLLSVLGITLPYQVKIDGRVKQTQLLVLKENKSRKSSTRKKKLLIKLAPDETAFLLEHCDDVRLYLRGTNGKKTVFERYLKLDEEWAFFLGVFLADGSINRKKGVIRIYLGTKKPHYEEVKKRLLRFLANKKIGYSLFEDRTKPVEEIRIYSQIMTYLLTDILKIGVRGISGRRGEEKDIPDILFVAPKSVKKAFIEGYIKSDGTPTGKGYTIVTASPHIYRKLPYLSHDCNFPVVFTRVVNTPKGKLYKGHTVNYRREQSIGNLVTATVVEIEEVKTYNHEWIYDLSVETDTEGNFICGIGGVCQHNTDPGREGELIGREILLMAGWKDWDRTYRFWTSEALTPDVVRRGLKNLRPIKEFDSLYYSALARQHGDWIVGINLTRLTTLKSSDRSVWSVGRVQTPTLKLIVDREREIENFKPQEYWVIKATFQKGDFKYEGTLLRDEKLAEKLIQELDKKEARGED